MASEKLLKVTLVRSLIGAKRSHRLNVKGLGLRRVNHTVHLPDNSSTRGMISKISYLVKLED